MNYDIITQINQVFSDNILVENLLVWNFYGEKNNSLLKDETEQVIFLTFFKGNFDYVHSLFCFWFTQMVHKCKVSN